MIQKAIFFFGVWEPSITAFFQRSLVKGDIVIDVGANIGYYSTLSAKLVSDSGKVHAIEASPSICELLRKNLEMNGCDNVSVHQAAVMDRVMSIPIYHGGERSLGTSTVLKEAAPQHGGTMEGRVTAMPLHQVVEPSTLFSARLIKIDIEGAEWPLIKGITPMLGLFSASTEWIIEVTPTAIRSQGGSAQEIVETFFQAGYRAYIFENHYDIDWYARETRRLLKETPERLVQPLTQPVESYDQLDLLFSRRDYARPPN